MFRESVRMLKLAWRRLLLFELAVQLTSLTLLVPLIGVLVELAIRLSGLEYLTRENIGQLLGSVWTFPLAAMLLALGLVYLLVQFTGVIACLDAACQGRRLPLGELVQELLSGVRRFFAPGTSGLALHLLLLVPMITVSAAGGVLSALGLPDLPGSLIGSQTLLIPVYAGIAAICLLLNIRRLPALPLFVTRRCSFRAAIRRSRRWMKGKAAGVFFSMLLWNMLYAGLLLAVLCLITWAGISLISHFGGSVIYGKMPLRILRYVLLGVIFVFSAGAVPHFSAGMMACWCRIRKERETPRKCIPAKSRKPLTRRSSRLLAVTAAAVLLTVNAAYLYRMATGEAALRFVFSAEPMTIAHRGASADAPENTIYAFAGAMETGADGIELDVQQTADGIAVVTHDSNLRRISGLNRKVSDVTYEELLDLDVGSWFDPAFQEARIMTLEEVFQFTGGEIFLNIELKSDAVGNGLEEQVAGLITEYGLEDRCCVTSFSYPALRRIKEIRPEIRTGFIMSYAYGNFYDLEAADAFSIKSTFINRQVVGYAHQRGKEIYAWTVNSVPEMQRMLNLSVDHIITDKPGLLLAQIDRDSTEDTLLDAVLRLTS